MENNIKFNKNISRQFLSTFLVCLVLASFFYESSDVSSALRTLQKGEWLIFMTHSLSMVYIAGIGTILLMVLHYFGRLILTPQPFEYMENQDKKKPHPQLVVVNSQTSRDLIDKMIISKN